MCWNQLWRWYHRFDISSSSYFVFNRWAEIGFWYVYGEYFWSPLRLIKTHRFFNLFIMWKYACSTRSPSKELKRTLGKNRGGRKDQFFKTPLNWTNIIQVDLNLWNVSKISLLCTKPLSESWNTNPRGLWSLSDLNPKLSQMQNGSNSGIQEHLRFSVPRIISWKWWYLKNTSLNLKKDIPLCQQITSQKNLSSKISAWASVS